MHRQRRPGGVYELRPLKNAGPPDPIPVPPQNSEPAQTLPRYVQTRKLASGMIAYYWCRPWWARGPDCPLKNEALGQYFDEVTVRAAILNAQLDSWRLDRNSPKACPLAVTPKACPFEGAVVEVLPDGRMRVQMDNGHAIVAYTAGRHGAVDSIFISPQSEDSSTVRSEAGK